MYIPVFTIDGPSGAGKGTISRALAKKLKWHYLDSGSIYRSLAIAALDKQMALDDERSISRLAQEMQLEFVCGDELSVKLNGIDITARLASETTGNTASRIAALPQVRKVLLQKQRDFRQPPGLIADGRDMGTVVFPEADYKVYLTASAAQRAERRYKQLMEKGIDANLGSLTKEIEERDKRDMERETAPLVAAPDAYFVDTSDMTIKQVIEEVMNLI